MVAPGWVIFVKYYEERELEIRFGESYTQYRVSELIRARPGPASNGQREATGIYHKRRPSRPRAFCLHHAPRSKMPVPFTLHMASAVHVQLLSGDVVGIAGQESGCLGDFFRLRKTAQRNLRFQLGGNFLGNSVYHFR